MAELQDQIRVALEEPLDPAGQLAAVMEVVEPVLDGWRRRAQAAEAAIARIKNMPAHEGDDGVVGPMEYLYAEDVLEALETNGEIPAPPTEAEADAAVARVRAYLDRDPHPHPNHDHLCPDDVRRELDGRAAVDA